MAKMKWYDWTAISLLIVGGLAWGVYGVTGFNIVQWLTGGISILEKLVYDLVGVASIYSIYSLLIKK